MSTDSLIPTPTVDELKAEISKIKEQAQIAALQEELESLKKPSEFEGAMQEPDDQKVLKTKRQSAKLMDLILERLIRMFAIRPIIGNIIALGLSCFALFYIYHEIDLAGFSGYRHYFGLGTLLFAALQIIKSSTRSLMLPILAFLVTGSLIAHSLKRDQSSEGYHQFFSQILRQSNMFLTHRTSSEYPSEHRHDSTEVRMQYD